MITEAKQYDIEILVCLRRTAREQDLLDGGDGREIYTFTREDAQDAEVDWGADGEPPDQNVRKLFDRN